MNLGALSSLSGFMMTDVLYLRTLSVFGSLCGITYNATREPRQSNGMLWGIVFVTTNAVMITKLILDRQEPKFSVDEMNLYKSRFEGHGVTPAHFFELMQIGTWETHEPGATLVDAGTFMDRVIYIHRGKAEAWAVQEDTAGSPRLLYDYDHGVIGGTALVDPTVMTRRYPNLIVAGAGNQRLTTVSFKMEELTALLAKRAHKATESALIHGLFVDLIQGLRRDRKSKSKKKKEKEKEQDQARSAQHHARLQEATRLRQRLLEYKALLSAVVSNGVALPAEKKLCRVFRAQHGLTMRQHDRMLEGLGWSREEWEDGGKH